MKNNINIIYKVDGFLYRNSNHKDNELITVNKEFKNKNAGIARKEAFSYYKSMIEVLLESKGLQYKNLQQAEEDLKDFYNSNNIIQHPKLLGISYNNDVDKLLTISFTSDEIPPYITKTGIKIYDEEYVVQAIGYESFLLKNCVEKNLQKEREILKRLKPKINLPKTNTLPKFVTNDEHKIK